MNDEGRTTNEECRGAGGPPAETLADSVAEMRDKTSDMAIVEACAIETREDIHAYPRVRIDAEIILGRFGEITAVDEEEIKEAVREAVRRNVFLASKGGAE